MPLDKKKGRDVHSKNSEVKINATFSKDDFLIVIPHWPTLCLSKISVSICKKNYIRKSVIYNLSLGISDENGRINNRGISICAANGRSNNLSTSITDIDVDRKADNSGINSSIADINRRVDNSGKRMGIADVDERVDNQGINTSTVNGEPNNSSKCIGIANINGRANNPARGMGTIDIVKKAVNPDTGSSIADKEIDDLCMGIIDIDVNKRVDKKMSVSNKICMFLFSLCKILFILISFSKSETIFASLFISLSSLITLAKWEALFFKYLVAKMWMPSFSKVLLAMTFVLMPLKFFAKYSLSEIVSYIYLLLITLEHWLLSQK